MPASQALLGYGAKFSVATDASPDVYQELAEVYTITPPSAVLDQIDVSHMQSPNRRREFISGMIDGGESTLEMNFIPGSTTDDRLFELLNLGVGLSRRRGIKIEYPNGVTESFEAELTGYEPSMTFDDKMTLTATWKVTGDVTRGST